MQLLRRGIAFGDHPPQALRYSVAYFFFRLTHEQFRKKSFGGRDKWGLVWPALSEITVRIKRAQGWPYPERILYQSGRLYRSLSPGKLGAGGAYQRPSQDQVALLRYKSIQVGTRVEYAAKHQYGKGKVPKRPFLPTEPWQLSEAVYKGVHRYLRILFRAK